MDGFKKTAVGNISAKLEEEYESKISELVNKINNSNLSQKNKLKIIYDYLVNSCEIYETFYMDGINQFPASLDAGITTASKYGPIIKKKGVCKGFSLAFQDIAQRCRIKTEIIEGVHNGFGHGWIVALDNFDNFTPKHIDIYSGIKNKNNNKNIYDYFMISTDKLYAIGDYSNFEESLNKAIQKLRGFKVLRK